MQSMTGIAIITPATLKMTAEIEFALGRVMKPFPTAVWGDMITLAPTTLGPIYWHSMLVCHVPSINAEAEQKAY